MASVTVTTVVKMLEALPEPMLIQIADHLREYIADLQAESQWDESFQKTQSKLAAAAHLAKQQIAAGESTPLDFSEL